MIKLIYFFVLLLFVTSESTAYTLNTNYPKAPSGAAVQFCQKSESNSLSNLNILDTKKSYPGAIYSDGTTWTYLLTIDFDDKATTPVPATASCLVANAYNQCARIVVTYDTYFKQDIPYFNTSYQVRFFSLPPEDCLNANLLN